MRQLQYLPFLVLFVWCGQSPLLAQKKIDYTSRTENYVWFRYELSVPLGEQWQLVQEIEERLHAQPWVQGEFRLRSHLVRTLGKGWTLDLGNAFVWESRAIEPRREDLAPRLEVRPHQQLSYEHALSNRWGLEHTYKIEQRFFENKNAEGQYRNAGMSLGQIRFRYELKVLFQLWDWLDLMAFDEVVLYTGPEIGPNPFDRNVAGAGVSLKLSDAFRLEATYHYRYNPEGIGYVVVGQHIGRFSLLHAVGRR